MEKYPDLFVLASDYDREGLDGRRNSRALDGRPRVQFTYEKTQHEFTITHPKLSTGDVQILMDFYQSNKGREFEFDNPEDGKTYICIFYSGPKFSDFVVNRKDVTFIITGEEAQ